MSLERGKLNARLQAGIFFYVALLLGGCATIAPQTVALKNDRPANLPMRVELEEVPFFPQEDYQCGPAALATVLNANGVHVAPEELTKQVYLPGRKGSLATEMLAAARRNGMLAYELTPTLPALLSEVAAGNPVVVLEDFGVSFYPLWHFAVVVGYDMDAGKLILRSGLRERQTVPFALFERVWRHADYWAMLALPPTKLPASADESRYLASAIALEVSGHVAGANTAYALLLTRWPKNPTARMGLGNTAYALGRLEQAEHAFRQATLDDPQSAAAFNNLAQTLADERRYAEALQVAAQAVKLGGAWRATSQTTLEEIRKRSHGTR